MLIIFLYLYYNININFFFTLFLRGGVAEFLTVTVTVTNFALSEIAKDSCPPCLPSYNKIL